MLLLNHVPGCLCGCFNLQYAQLKKNGQNLVSSGLESRWAKSSDDSFHWSAGLSVRRNKVLKSSVLMVMNNPSGQRVGVGTEFLFFLFLFFPLNSTHIKTKAKLVDYNYSWITFFCPSNNTISQSRFLTIWILANATHESPRLWWPPSAANELKPNVRENGGRGPHCVRSQLQ